PTFTACALSTLVKLSVPRAKPLYAKMLVTSWAAHMLASGAKFITTSGMNSELPNGLRKFVPWALCWTLEGSSQPLSSFSSLYEKMISFVAVGERTEVTFATADLPVDVPLIGVGSGMLPGCHHRPRGFSVNSVSRARRTYVRVLSVML